MAGRTSRRRRGGCWRGSRRRSAGTCSRPSIVGRNSSRSSGPSSTYLDHQYSIWACPLPSSPSAYGVVRADEGNPVRPRLSAPVWSADVSSDGRPAPLARGGRREVAWTLSPRSAATAARSPIARSATTSTGSWPACGWTGPRARLARRPCPPASRASRRAARGRTDGALRPARAAAAAPARAAGAGRARAARAGPGAGATPGGRDPAASYGAAARPARARVGPRLARAAAVADGPLSGGTATGEDDGAVL